MTVRSCSAGSVASLLSCLLLATCAGRTAPTPLRPEAPALDATMNELIDRLSAIAAENPAFVSEGSLRFEDLATHKSREVGLRFACRKPDELRLQGNKALLP